MKKIIIIMAIALFALAGCVVEPAAETSSDGLIKTETAATEVVITKNYDEFAQCLTQKGVNLYTTSWCPHCKNQKAMFGDSLKYLKFFECDTTGAKECGVKGVQSVPAWEFPNSKELVTGTRSLEEISKLGGCPLN